MPLSPIRPTHEILLLLRKSTINIDAPLLMTSQSLVWLAVNIDW